MGGSKIFYFRPRDLDFTTNSLYGWQQGTVPYLQTSTGTDIARTVHVYSAVHNILWDEGNIYTVTVFTGTYSFIKKSREL